MVLMIIDRLLTGFSAGVLLGHWVVAIITVEKRQGKDESILEWVDADWAEVD